MELTREKSEVSSLHAVSLYVIQLFRLFKQKHKTGGGVGDNGAGEGVDVLSYPYFCVCKILQGVCTFFFCCGFFSDADWGFFFVGESHSSCYLLLGW